MAEDPEDTTLVVEVIVEVVVYFHAIFLAGRLRQPVNLNDQASQTESQRKGQNNLLHAADRTREKQCIHACNYRQTRNSRALHESSAPKEYRRKQQGKKKERNHLPKCAVRP